MISNIIGSGYTAQVADLGDGTVVKLFRSGYPRDAVEREYSNAVLMQKMKLPIPQVHRIVEMEGRTGIVYDRLYALITEGDIPDGAADKGALQKLRQKIADDYLENMQVPYGEIERYVSVIRKCRIYELKK